MHPEEVQISGPVQVLVQEPLKPHETAEDDIDVENVDNGDHNGSEVKGLNGNGVHRKENGHSDQFEGEGEKISEEERLVHDFNVLNGAEKSILRLKSGRRNSTSSRSSSVSSVPSMKHQSPVALQMEVSMDEEEKEHMDPLIIEGAAEDLEVSKCVETSEADEGEGVTTDSEALPTEYDEYAWQGYQEGVFKTTSTKSAKGTKQKSVSKVKTPRTKSLKLKGSKPPAHKISEVDYDDSVLKEDSEGDEPVVKSSKSPPKRSKSGSKHDQPLDEENDAEQAPRRSSRARQTPQKYNSSLYVDPLWDLQTGSEDRLNNSDVALGGSIRSVKGRRSLRKSRNISALNASLHNESSPWETDFKVLTPCGGGLSIHDSTIEGKADSSTPLKRKAVDEDNDEDTERGLKKMCVENPDLNSSTSSFTSSFFSVITSPIVLLKNKLRGSSVSSSTPIRSDETKVDDAITGVPSESLPLQDAADAAAAPTLDTFETPETANTSDTPADAPAVSAAPAAQEVRSWCMIM